MSWLSDLFKTQVEGRGWEQVPLTDAERQAIATLQGIGTTPIESSVRKIAPATETEKYGYGLLSDFTTGIPEGYSLGYSLAKDVATTPVDVTKIPEYQGILQDITKAGSLEANRLGRSLQLRGAATSGPARDILGRQVTETQKSLVGALAPFAEAERSRQFSAIPLLGQFAEATDKAAMNRLDAIQRYTLERDLVQAGFDAQYAKELADISIQLQQEQMRLQAAAAILERTGYAYNAGISLPSIFSQFAKPASQVASSYFMSSG